VTLIVICAPEEGRLDETVKFYELLQTFNRIIKNGYTIIAVHFNDGVWNTPVKSTVGINEKRRLK
jgi:hypothetical protein